MSTALQVSWLEPQVGITVCPLSGLRCGETLPPLEKVVDCDATTKVDSGHEDDCLLDHR